MSDGGSSSHRNQTLDVQTVPDRTRSRGVGFRTQSEPDKLVLVAHDSPATAEGEAREGDLGSESEPVDLP